MSLTMPMHPAETLRKQAASFNCAIDSLDFANKMDAQDELACHRSEFHIPIHQPTGEPIRYFSGNSLGLQHKGVEAALQQELRKWREQAVEGHFLQPNPWFEVDDVLREDVASIVGALATEVVVMNTLTTNLHLLMSAFYRPTKQRFKIMVEQYPFPSDTHALISQLLTHGYDPKEGFVEVKSVEDGQSAAVIPTDSFLKCIEQHGDSSAVLLLGAVHFLTGQFFDIGKICAAAHAKGMLVGVDCAHAVGNVPLKLHDWGVDFACWCSYKYLNGGPGNIAGAFVHEKHTPKMQGEGEQQQQANATEGSVVNYRGWWGHDRATRFSLSKSFKPAEGAAAFQLSNPCIMAMMSLAPSLKLCSTIGMDRLRAKSLLLTAYLELLIDAQLADKIEIVTPRDVQQRGCQLSVRILPKALKIPCPSLDKEADVAQKALLERGVMCDNRPPDILRLAPVPTYNSFGDVRCLVEQLKTLF